MHNYEEIIDSSAVVTATGAGATAQNNRASGAFIVIEVTAVNGTPSMVAKVQWSADGANWIDLDSTNAVSPAITAVGRTVIKVYPTLPTVAAGSCNSPLPRLWRLFYTITGSTSLTFSSSASYITTED